MDQGRSNTIDILAGSLTFPDEKLTPRELDILALLAQNLSDREIAGRLTLALSSVKWYARQIYDKLGVDNRRQAVMKAGELKLLESRRKSSPPAHNLPRQLTRFIGREKEMAQVIEWVRKYPLVTLTGPGGVGKTRLAIAVANKLLDDFPDGVWLVELASLSDPKQVLRVAANAVGVHEDPGHTLLDSLIFFFNDRQVLLILDNAEHLVDEVARITNSLLQAATGLKLLATSRESLGVDGERVFRVPSLQVPLLEKAGCVQPMEELIKYESVELFVDRAQVALPEFQVTAQEVGPVARICQRLDGIPLAIELAASRVVGLEVAQIANRLEHDFRMLSGGSRTALERQRTLRATIDWSYNLLSDKEQRLFRSLAVFSGGWTLPAAETVCENEHIPQNEVLDLLTRLADKSVILFDRQPGMDTRYRLLESLRHFAAEKLSESGESEALRSRHCEWFLRFAEIAQQKFATSDGLLWLKKLKADLENLRATLEWSIRENGDPQAGLHILVALSDHFWGLSPEEVYQWFEQGMAAIHDPSNLDPLLNVNIMINMASIKSWLNPAEEKPHLEEVVTFCRDMGLQGRKFHAYALNQLGWLEVMGLGNLPEALIRFTEAETIIRSFGPEGRKDLPNVLPGKIYVLALLNDQIAEQTYTDEYLGLYQEFGDTMCMIHKQLGDIALRRKDFAMANRHYSEDLAFNLEVGDFIEASDLNRKLADVERAQGHYEQAFVNYSESLKLAYEHGGFNGVNWVLTCLAFSQIEISRNQPPVERTICLRRAARLFGAVQAMVDLDGNPFKVPAEIKAEYERDLGYLKENLDPGAFQASWAEGRSMKVNQAVAYALEDIRCPVSGPS